MDFIQPDWPAPSHVKACTTLRSIWGHQDTNLKEYSARQQLKTLLNLPSEPVWINQIHGALAIEAQPQNMDKDADATYTSNVNHICIVTTADCLPILICNKQGTHVAAIHAGWRGLASGIIEATVKAMQLPSDDLLVWLGPALARKSLKWARMFMMLLPASIPNPLPPFCRTAPINGLPIFIASPK